jgi:hypothetical protein
MHKIIKQLTTKIKYSVCRMRGKQKVHFLHIGKTGGSAIKYTLKEYPVSADYKMLLHSHRTKLRDIPRGQKVFFFLREPISRFVSGFYSRQRQGQPRIFNPWTPDEKKAFEYFRTPNDLAVAISSADVEEKDRAHTAMSCIGHIRNSYWDWFESEEFFRSRLSDILFIGFQERLNDDFEILKSKLGLYENAKLPDNDIRAHRNPTDLDRTLSDEAIKNLKEWYKKDYEFIDLCEEVIREHPVLRDSSTIFLMSSTIV